jgi:hypothetical protein
MSARPIRARLSFANVASALALFIAIGGGSAFALAGRNTVTSDDIVRGNVRTSDIAHNAVTASKINNAASGSDAVNADKLDAISGENYQLGDGFSGGGGFVANDGDSINPIAILGGGHLSFSCGSPTSTLAYIDNGGDPFATDFWLGDGATATHTTVADGSSKTGLLPASDSAGTVHFQVFSAVADDVTFSWFVDPSSSPANQCFVAVNTQTNGYSLAAGRHRGPRAAGQRPTP